MFRAQDLGMGGLRFRVDLAFAGDTKTFPVSGLGMSGCSFRVRVLRA